MCHSVRVSWLKKSRISSQVDIIIIQLQAFFSFYDTYLVFTDADADKENIPDNIIPPQPRDAEIMLSSKLQEAGLADIIPPPNITEVPLIQTQRPTISTSHRKSQTTGSESSETPLGSLDRTKVSLGDSEQTTDSKRFIRCV